MSRSFKIALIIAAVLIVLGLALGGAKVLSGKLELPFNTRIHETARTIDESFDSIEIDASVYDISFHSAESDFCEIISLEDERYPLELQVENGRLMIREVHEQKWYINFGINTGSPKLAVYLPENDYETLRISSSTSDIDIPADFSFSSANIELSIGNVNIAADVEGSYSVLSSTGDIYLANAACESLTVTASTGRISLENIIAADRLNVENSTGDIRIENCDAEHISLETSTGSISGTLLSGKSFDADSSTGDIDIPASTDGGYCKLRSSTGDIRIKIG